MNIRRITTLLFVLAIFALIVGLSACDELVTILSSDDTPQMEGEDIPNRCRLIYHRATRSLVW